MTDVVRATLERELMNSKGAQSRLAGQIDDAIRSLAKMIQRRDELNVAVRALEAEVSRHAQSGKLFTVTDTQLRANNIAACHDADAVVDGFAVQGGGAVFTININGAEPPQVRADA